MDKKKKKYELNSKLIFRKEGDEYLVYNSEDDSCYVINKTGSKILELIMKGIDDRENIVSTILEEYKNAKEVRNIEKDINKFLEKLNSFSILSFKS